jgi:hypothetical protein
MPLIPYPDVPNLPGVPALSRSNNAQYAAAALTVIGELLPNNLFGTKWAITDSGGHTALVPDSFVAFEYKNERKIPNYPIEEGSFQSYNKVALPFDCRLTVTCSGNGSMSKQGFLAAIQNYLDSLTLLTIVTPDATYANCNLIHADYRRESRQGATLLMAQLFFQEVRIAQQPAPPTADPSGASNENNGQVSVTSPSGASAGVGDALEAEPL